jgi:hypothetical protein
MKSIAVLFTSVLSFMFCTQSVAQNHSQRLDYRSNINSVSDNYDNRFQRTRKHYRKSTIARSVFPKQREATGKNVFVFSPAKLAWAAYDGTGRLVRHGRASGGAKWCADEGRPCRTPAGSYAVYRMKGADCKSSKYPIGRGGALMPYCMFFHGGYAIHGSPDLPDYNASHGCVRVHPTDAKWLYNNFIRHGTRVIVQPYGSRAV